MKAFNKILSIIGISAAFAACNTLEQFSPSSFSAEETYSDYNLARYAVNGIYEAYVTTSAYRSDYMTYYGANTDCEYWLNPSDADEKNTMCEYRIYPTNTYVNRSNAYDFFPATFISIERANVAIHNLRKYGNVERDSKMAHLLGEALTMRAAFYADLLNYYGEVPARFEPIGSDNVYLPKADKDEIYKQLLPSLEEAAKLMKFETHTTTVRASKALAIGLYARLALQACGYSRRPDEGKVNTGDLGSIRKSTDPELQPEILYPKAIEMLDEVIQSQKYHLFENFEDLWHYYCNLKTSIDENGSEMIFQMPFGINRGQHIYHNGVPNTKLGFGSSPRKGCVPTLFFKFQPFDTRRDVTCCFFRWGSADNVSNTTETLRADKCYFGKFRYDWMKDHPYTAKDAEDGAKFPVLRYADIYLMASEMANEMDDLPAAKEYMRPVLDRAFHDDIEVAQYLDSLDTKLKFFQAIKDQRAFEFTGEMLRKQDLIRWGCLKEALDSTISELKHLLKPAKADQVNGYGYTDNLYFKVDPNDPYKVDIKFVKTGESLPQGYSVRNHFFSTCSSKLASYYYVEDPDLWMYRPIPSSIIIASLGTIKNDYGY